MDAKELQKRISEVNPERISAYQSMFDRILLYNLATSLLSKEQLESTVDWVDRIVKRTIDVDSQTRTNFLQSTKEGRLARLTDEPDGEDLRLLYLKTWEVTKDLIKSNLIRP
jgi:hypothetical protein